MSATLQFKLHAQEESTILKSCGAGCPGEPYVIQFTVLRSPCFHKSSSSFCKQQVPTSRFTQAALNKQAPGWPQPCIGPGKHNHSAQLRTSNTAGPLTDDGAKGQQAPNQQAPESQS